MIGGTRPAGQWPYDSFAPAREDDWNRLAGSPFRARESDETEAHSQLGQPLVIYHVILVNHPMSTGQEWKVRVSPGRSLTSPDAIREISEAMSVLRLDTAQTWIATERQARGASLASSTVYDESPVPVHEYVEAAFGVAVEETFENGRESEFSERLTWLVRKYGVSALDTIARLMTSEQVNVEVTAEALKSLGEMHHPESYSRRLQLLVRSLRSSSPWVRDGATLGLAWLDDPTTIPYLGRAAEQEPIEELRQNMEAVLEQLEESRLCR